METQARNTLRYLSGLSWKWTRRVLETARRILFVNLFKGRIPKDQKVFLARAWRYLKKVPGSVSRKIKEFFAEVKSDWQDDQTHRWKWTKRGLKTLVVMAITVAGISTIRAFLNAVSTPAMGWLYAMQVNMPDGSTEVKFGMTSRTPEIRVAELNANPAKEGVFTVHAQKQVDLDVMHASEDALLAKAQELAGAPTVGLEQFDGIPLENAADMLEAAEIAGMAAV